MTRSLSETILTSTLEGMNIFIPPHYLINMKTKPWTFSKDMPRPSAETLNDPIFQAIWECIKTWDVNVPEYYAGYCGANGSHVQLILNALDAVYVNQFMNDPKPLPELKEEPTVQEYGAKHCGQLYLFAAQEKNEANI